MNTKSISVKTERFYSAHHTLLRIAKENLLKAESKEPGWFDSQFTAITISSLAVEAFCNALGEKVINQWSDFESSNPIAKIRLLCEHLEINFDSGKEPWGSIITVCRIRNLIAHPKAEYVIYKDVLTQEEHNTQEYRNAPKSKLEKKITLENARKSIAAVDKLIDMFCEKLTMEQKFGIVGDMWHSSSKLYEVS